MNPRSSATRVATRKNTKTKKTTRKSAAELYRRVCPRTSDLINILGQETWATADMLFTMSKILTDLELSHVVQFPDIYPDEGVLYLEWDGELRCALSCMGTAR